MNMLTTGENLWLTFINRLFINLARSKLKTPFAKLRAYSVKTNVHITRCDFVAGNEQSSKRF